MGTVLREHTHTNPAHTVLCSYTIPPGEDDLWATCRLPPRPPIHEGERTPHGRRIARIGTSSSPADSCRRAERSCGAGGSGAATQPSPAPRPAAAPPCPQPPPHCPPLPVLPAASPASRRAWGVGVGWVPGLGRSAPGGGVEGVLGEAAALLIARINNLSRLVSASNRQTSDVVFRRQQRSDQRLQLEGDY